MCDMNTLGLVPVSKSALLQPWVTLELVHGGLDGGVLNQTFHFGFAEVGDADCFYFAGGDELFHCFVCLGCISFIWVKKKDGGLRQASQCPQE